MTNKGYDAARAKVHERLKAGSKDVNNMPMITIRLPAALREQINAAAKDAEMSTNAYCLAAIMKIVNKPNIMGIPIVIDRAMGPGEFRLVRSKNE